MKKKNIKLILLIEFALFVIVFLYTLIACGVDSSQLLLHISWFFDVPSITIIALLAVPGLILMGEWKDFIKAFSVGEKEYTLMELKNINEAVSAGQKLTIFGGIFAFLISLIILFGQLSSPETIGPNLAVCIISCFYVALIEFLLLPLRINVIKHINKEMDFDEEFASEMATATDVSADNSSDKTA